MIPLISTLIPLVGDVLDRVIPDKAEAQRVKNEIALQMANNETELQKAVLDLAKEDAKTGKGGYRWGAGWLAVISCGYAWIGQPVLSWAILAIAPDVAPPPPIDPAMQYAMLTGMLGLAGVRSYDLRNGSRV